MLRQLSTINAAIRIPTTNETSQCRAFLPSQAKGACLLRQQSFVRPQQAVGPAHGLMPVILWTWRWEATVTILIKPLLYFIAVSGRQQYSLPARSGWFAGC